MRECKNYPEATCDKNCALTGKCSEDARLRAAERLANAPVTNDQTAIQDRVIADIETRKRVGLERYGTLLQPFNGRPALVDAYQEALDLTQYLRQLLEEDHQLSAALLDLVVLCEDHDLERYVGGDTVAQEVLHRAQTLAHTYRRALSAAAIHAAR